MALLSSVGPSAVAGFAQAHHVAWLQSKRWIGAKLDDVVYLAGRRDSSVGLTVRTQRLLDEHLRTEPSPVFVVATSSR